MTPDSLTKPAVEVSRVVSGNLSVDIRDRQISHVIAALSEQVIKTSGANPRGLTVVVTCEPSTTDNPQPDWVVRASAPLYS